VAVVAIIVFGKSLAAFLIVLAFRYPLNTALTVSASLAQIGEFSFILAGLGVSLKLLDDDARNLILAGALISIALNPFVFNAIEPVQRWIRARSPLAKAVERSNDPLAELPMSIDERVLPDTSYWSDTVAWDGGSRKRCANAMFASSLWSRTARPYRSSEKEESPRYPETRQRRGC
jgi:hypothetical protein